MEVVVVVVVGEEKKGLRGEREEREKGNQRR